MVVDVNNTPHHRSSSTMKYNHVTRVSGSKAPAYFLGRPRSFYRDETVPAVPLSVVRGVEAAAEMPLAA